MRIYSSFYYFARIIYAPKNPAKVGQNESSKVT